MSSLFIIIFNFIKFHSDKLNFLFSVLGSKTAFGFALELCCSKVGQLGFQSFKINSCLTDLKSIEKKNQVQYYNAGIKLRHNYVQF